MEVSTERRNRILDEVFAWSAAQGFRGYNKHDGLNSPILNSCLGWAKWPRIVAIQSVMRLPFNIRPFLLVPKTINPKGLALFILGLINRYGHDGKVENLENAKELTRMLLSQRSMGQWSGNCWGYPYPWQDLGFFAPSNTPNAVVSSFVCEALLQMYRVTGEEEYLNHVGSAIEFFLNDLTVLRDTENHLCLAYMPVPMSMRVMDVSILIGAVISQYAAMTQNKDLLKPARRLVRYVVDQQTDYGAWFYTDPPGDSLIRHDNYHTGFVLDALWRYMKAADEWEWKEKYEIGLRFYAENLFNQDGSPRWMSDQNYPHDVHGAAQGLITFSNACVNKYSDYEDLVRRIEDWAISNLYVKGRFFYRKYALFTVRYTLLRWCNAWMFMALSGCKEQG